MSPDYNRISAALRELITSRANGLCEYCKCSAEFSPDPFALDHIAPRQLGGETNKENLALSCSGCNGHKHARTHYPDPETKQLVKLFHPRQQKWSEHFSWDEHLTRMVGKTPCGRATIDALLLNRPEVVNLRRLLVAAKLHPFDKQ
jgi:5-methylcytosine-specific restriction endonuclease McrA